MYDARDETPGWDSPGFRAQAWLPSRTAEKPATTICPQASPPIRAVATMAPVSARQVEPGVHVFDFGQNFAGWCRLRARAPAGSMVEMKFAERLLESGRVDQSNLRSALGRVLYTFSGKDTPEEYQPTFTYFGFRYVEITGLSGDPPADLLEGVVISTDLPVVGAFSSSSPLLNRIWANTYWSQRSNFVGIPTDCPQRDERLGWMGDAQVFWDSSAPLTLWMCWPMPAMSIW
ncbi:MAG: family 78 glycoside hydrolase catalytic domain [Rudaea sp.]|uniref:family 78 glycoside hydrolase catalytic domain n=1 Tax=Rudaea sp. TaxID=2136325 RepID=UPI0039E54B63